MKKQILSLATVIALGATSLVANQNHLFNYSTTSFDGGSMSGLGYAYNGNGSDEIGLDWEISFSLGSVSYDNSYADDPSYMSLSLGAEYKTRENINFHIGRGADQLQYTVDGYYDSYDFEETYGYSYLGLSYDLSRELEIGFARTIPDDKVIVSSDGESETYDVDLPDTNTLSIKYVNRSGFTAGLAHSTYDGESDSTIMVGWTF